MPRASATSGPEQIADGKTRHSDQVSSGVVQKVGQLPKTPLHSFDKVRWLRGKRLVARRQAWEFRGQREVAGSIQARARYFEKRCRAYEVCCADRDQLMDVARRELSGLAVGK